MKRLAAVAVVIALALFQTSAATASPTPTGAAGPSIKFIVVQEYRLSVFGSHWAPHSRIVFTVHQPNVAVGVELRSNNLGNFLVGINSIDLCSDTNVVARDFAGHRLTIAPPGRGCPPQPHPPTPVLRVLARAAIDIKVTHFDLGHTHGAVVIVRGDAVYIWEAGVKSPAWVPRADRAFFEHIGQGTTPPRECPQIECDAGFFWEFVGMKAGKTVITVHCGPGRVCVQLLIAIPVKILPWHEPRTPKPTLTFIPLNSHLAGISGTNWAPNSKVTFAVRQGPMVTGLELQTTSAGDFMVGIDNFDVCLKTVVESRDFMGRRATTVLSFGCRPQPPEPIPVITIMKGTLVTINVRHIDGIGARGPVVIRLGDAIYLWEPGTKRPAFIPTAPTRFFAIIGEGKTLPRKCSQIECSAGFFWEWVGVHTGKTEIGMNPKCRYSKPECAIASYAIPVRIKS